MTTVAEEARTFHKPLDAEGWVSKMRAEAKEHGVDLGAVLIEAIDGVGIVAQIQLNGEQEAIRATRKAADAEWAAHLKNLSRNRS